jgi:hypothetical protein
MPIREEMGATFRVTVTFVNGITPPVVVSWRPPPWLARPGPAAPPVGPAAPPEASGELLGKVVEEMLAGWRGGRDPRPRRALTTSPRQKALHPHPGLA